MGQYLIFLYLAVLALPFLVIFAGIIKILEKPDIESRKQGRKVLLAGIILLLLLIIAIFIILKCEQT